MDLSKNHGKRFFVADSLSIHYRPVSCEQFMPVPFKINELWELPIYLYGMEWFFAPFRNEMWLKNFNEMACKNSFLPLQLWTLQFYVKPWLWLFPVLHYVTVRNKNFKNNFEWQAKFVINVAYVGTVFLSEKVFTK